MSRAVEVPHALLEDFLNHRDNGDWYDGVWITHLERLRSLLTNHSEEPIGVVEPIYQVQYRGDGGGGWSDAEKASYDAKVPHPKHWMTRIVYISPPAPVAVVLPDSYMLVERSIWTEEQAESAAKCITMLKNVPGMTDRDLALAAMDAGQCHAPEITLADLACLDKVKELSK